MNLYSNCAISLLLNLSFFYYICTICRLYIYYTVYYTYTIYILYILYCTLYTRRRCNVAVWKELNTCTYLIHWKIYSTAVYKFRIPVEYSPIYFFISPAILQYDFLWNTVLVWPPLRYDDNAMCVSDKIILESKINNFPAIVSYQCICAAWLRVYCSMVTIRKDWHEARAGILKRQLVEQLRGNRCSCGSFLPLGGVKLLVFFPSAF